MSVSKTSTNMFETLVNSLSEGLPTKTLNQLKGTLQDMFTETFKENEELKSSVEKLSEELKDKKAEIKELSKLRAKVDEFHEKEKELAIREVDLNKKQMELEFKEKEMELVGQHSKEMIDKLMEMYKIPFANRIIRESVQHPGQVLTSTYPSGSYDQQGNPVMSSGQHQEPAQTTTSEKEEK